jgi:hypothetical protein
MSLISTKESQFILKQKLLSIRESHDIIDQELKTNRRLTGEKVWPMVGEESVWLTPSESPILADLIKYAFPDCKLRVEVGTRYYSISRTHLMHLLLLYRARYEMNPCLKEEIRMAAIQRKYRPPGTSGAPGGEIYQCAEKNFYSMSTNME